MMPEVYKHLGTAAFVEKATAQLQALSQHHGLMLCVESSQVTSIDFGVAVDDALV